MSNNSEMMDADIVESPNQIVDGLPAESLEEKLLQEQMAAIK